MTRAIYLCATANDIKQKSIISCGTSEGVHKGKEINIRSIHLICCQEPSPDFGIGLLIN